ncbi:hypothetical protein Ancab_035562 [Ancistrocladus abbreviatus]
MELNHKLLNLFLPLLSLLSLLIVLPFYVGFKVSSSILRSIFVESIQGKVVLITGAALGIGEQLAYEYAKRGAYLGLTDVKEDRLKCVGNKCLVFGSPDVVVLLGMFPNSTIASGLLIMQRSTSDEVELNNFCYATSISNLIPTSGIKGKCSNFEHFLLIGFFCWNFSIQLKLVFAQLRFWINSLV